MKIRRILGVLMCTALVVSFFPVSARADGPYGGLTVTGGTEDTDYSYDDPSGLLTILTGTALTLSEGTTSVQVLVPFGVEANITLSGASIAHDRGDTTDRCALDIAPGAKANIFLEGANYLRSSGGSAGLQCPAGAEVVISDGPGAGTASLLAVGSHVPPTNSYGAGIGGGDGEGGGTITVESGAVEAFGGSWAAGIGGGRDGSDGGTVNIYGGAVTAWGGDGAAGIGGGPGLASGGGDGGTVHIYGGTVTAAGGAGGGGAGVGGGSGGGVGGGGTAGTLYISGGSVKITNGGSGPFAGAPASPVRSAADPTPLYLTKVALDGLTSETAVDALTTDAGYAYGTTGMSTRDDSGSQVLYLYLPAGTLTTAAETAPLSQTYVGSIETLGTGLGAGTLTLYSPPPPPPPVADDTPAPSDPNTYVYMPGSVPQTYRNESGTVVLPPNMLSNIRGASGKKVEITLGPGDISSLPAGARAGIGGRPVIRITLRLDGVQTDYDNPAAPVTISIPYTPNAAELENPACIIVWYIDGDGNLHCVPNGRYDAETGTVTFSVTHFSLFAVGYNPMFFNDVPESAWHYGAVTFIASRGITGGTGGGNYSPQAELTRADFLVMLMRAYGIGFDEDPADNFSDAGDAYYTGYLAAAKRLGIAEGVGNNMYAPEKAITRQEMFKLLYGALGVIGQPPRGGSGKTLSDFPDAGGIAPWANGAMAALVEAGVVGGSGGRLNPTAATTRAEMAQVLYHLLSA